MTNPTLASAFGVWVVHPTMPMDDRERPELQRLRDEFLEIMRRQNDAVLFNDEAQQRIGQSIGRSFAEVSQLFSSAFFSELFFFRLCP